MPPLDAVIGNVPFADVKLEHHGERFSLHDYFIAKSVDSLKPGGVLAVVTSHFTLDKQNASIRQYLAGRADFLGAIRLPSTAFKNEGTAVVTDVVFLRKRAPGEKAHHADPYWEHVAPLEIEGSSFPVNRYFLNHPEMVLGTWTARDTLYGEGYSVAGSGDLAAQLQRCDPPPAGGVACDRRPRRETSRATGFHPSPAAQAHRRGQFLHPRRPHRLPVDRRPVRPGRLRRRDAHRLRLAHRQAPGRPGGTARPRPPRPAIAERGLARDAPQRRPPRTQLGL